MLGRLDAFGVRSTHQNHESAELISRRIVELRILESAISLTKVVERENR